MMIGQNLLAKGVEISGSAVLIRKFVPGFGCQITKRIKTVGGGTYFR